MLRYRFFSGLGVLLLSAASVQAAQVWQSTFDSSADGVVDIFNNDSLKTMIGPASGGRLQITTADNGTNAFTPDKAGRPLGATKGGADSFSGLYKFNWSSLEQTSTETYEAGGFLGNASPQTRQIWGYILRHAKDAQGNYLLGVDLAAGSVGATNVFGYQAGPPPAPFFLNLGPNAVGTNYQLAVGWDGSTRTIEAAIYDAAGNLIYDHVAPINTLFKVGAPGGSTQAQVDTEVGALAVTHLGWEDYTGNALDHTTVWQVDSLSYFDDSRGAFNAAAAPEPAALATTVLAATAMLRRKRRAAC